MSRWLANFNNHSFQTSWKRLVEINHEIVADNITTTTDVEEVARYRKIVSYINQLIIACDPELTPESVWANFESQSRACLEQITAYQQDRIIKRIKIANQNLDNLLTYIAPFVKDSNNSAIAAATAFKEYENAIFGSLSTQAQRIEDIVISSNSNLDRIEDRWHQTEELYLALKNLHEEIFKEDGLELKSKRALNLSEENSNRISALHHEIFEGSSGKESVENSIYSYLEEAKTKTDKIDTLLSNNDNKLKELQRFYASVYGIEDSEGKKTVGLQQEIHNRILDLDKFKSNHETQYDAFVSEIESLVSGATSAGLAKAYFDLKESFNTKIQFYSRLFFCAIAGLLTISAFSLVNKIGWFYIEMVNTSEPLLVLSNLINKLPFILPALWLAVFASRRRSEADRLQQEYAHKEAIAKSYENFKKQIQALGESDPELMKKLLSSAIDAISDNASQTLDKKNKESTPLHELIEKASPDIEKLLKLLPSKNGG